MSPVVFTEEVAVVAISPADGGTGIDGATIWTEKGNELSTELLESVGGMENGMGVDVDVVSPDAFSGRVRRGGCCAGVLVCHYWGGVLGCFY